MNLNEAGRQAGGRVDEEWIHFGLERVFEETRDYQEFNLKQFKTKRDANKMFYLLILSFPLFTTAQLGEWRFVGAACGDRAKCGGEI